MTDRQPDLFSSLAAADVPAPGLVPGLSLSADFLSPAEEALLIRRIDAEPLATFKFQQWEGKRMTVSFGWSYDFTAGRVERAPPMPAWLQPIRERAARFAQLRADDLVQALLIRYDPGAGIGWHRDRPMFDQVLGISLGNPALLRLRRRHDGGFERARAELAPRSIYRLSGEVRHHWEHSITPMQVPRWSITFRSLA